MRARARGAEDYCFDARGLQERGIHPRGVADVAWRDASYLGGGAIHYLHDRGICRHFEGIAREEWAHSRAEIGVCRGNAIYYGLDFGDRLGFRLARDRAAFDLEG